MDVFFSRVFQYDWNERKPRQMLFQVQRFVTLANEIDEIRPARDDLRMLFINCCLESLQSLSGMKKTQFYEYFSSVFSDSAKQYILNNFSLSYIEIASIGLECETKNEFSIDDVLSIIKEMRNMVVHEGNYWSLQIFAYDNDSTWLPHIETNQQLLSKKTFENKEKQVLMYHFKTTLQYEKFIFYFVDACIKFINNYIDELSEIDGKKT